MGVGLTVLGNDQSGGAEAMVRMVERAEEMVAAALSETVGLDCGTAYVSAEFSLLNEANGIFLAQAAGVDLAHAIVEVRRAFAERGASCREWHFPAGVSAEGILAAAGERGLRIERDFILRMGRPRFARRPVVTIVPGRSSYAALKGLAGASEEAWAEGEVDEAHLRQCEQATERLLDEPRIDNLLALSPETHPELPAAGTVYVISVGEAMVLFDLYVHPAVTRRGIATALLERAVELAARSRAKHLLLACAEDDAPALALYEKLGFVRVGERQVVALPAEGD